VGIANDGFQLGRRPVLAAWESVGV
jgi:hypothetical protein